MRSRLLLALAALTLAACQTTTPSVADMDKYYREAQAQAERDIDRLRLKMKSGEISSDQFEYRAQEIRDSVPHRAMKMAWARHELVESQKRSLGIPTGDHPVAVDAPGRGGSESFYRAAGTTGSGYQGMGSGMWHGYQPGSMSNSFNSNVGF